MLGRVRWVDVSDGEKEGWCESTGEQGLKHLPLTEQVCSALKLDKTTGVRVKLRRRFGIQGRVQVLLLLVYCLVLSRCFAREQMEN